MRVTWLYDLAIRLYILGIQLAAIINPKAQQWIKGRKGLFQEVEQKIKAWPGESSRIWMHCASLGEFEQGRPIIELLKQQSPDLKVIISFFSPSGFEIRKNYEQADLVCYLPADTKKNASRFIETLQPDLALFVKYEFWHHHLEQLQQKKVPTLLISALFRPDQFFFKPYGKFFRQILGRFQHIFVQNKESAILLENIQIKNYSFGGDSRVDRVANIASNPKKFPIVAQFAGKSKILMAGSTWPADEKILTKFANQNLPQDWKVIIAPHQISQSAIQELSRKLQLSSVRYSEAGGKELDVFRVLLVDNVGMLAHLYQYATLAYIGGGFGAGIHNTLEPIAFGLPLFFGPKYQKFAEANYLVEKDAAVVVRESKDLNKGFENWLDQAAYKQSSRQALKYVRNNQGASEKIVQYINHLMSN